MQALAFIQAGGADPGSSKDPLSVRTRATVAAMPVLSAPRTRGEG